MTFVIVSATLPNSGLVLQNLMRSPATQVVALQTALEKHDPLHGVWEAIQRSRSLPPRLRPINVDCAA